MERVASRIAIGTSGTNGKDGKGAPRRTDPPRSDAGGGKGCQGIIGHPTQPCDSIPTYPGVKITLVEDFDSPLDLDTDPIWTYSDGFSDQAQARFVKSAITFANGSAQITR